MLYLTLTSEDEKYFTKLKYNSSFEWVCPFCQQEHFESELRNFQRRAIKCPCQRRQQQIQELQKELGKVNYKFLDKENNSYQLTKTKKVDIKKPILVQCLKCSKISYEYYQNIRIGHKKCNCNPNKSFTRNFSTDDFLAKWHPLNQDNFTLVEGENYKNRNTKYRIRCKKCKKEDQRWGISLIDHPIKCKYCDQRSIGEALIEKILTEANIDFQREYNITINEHLHRFDFYLPTYRGFIEYNGLQHYQAIPYFGGEEKFKTVQERDQEKKIFCELNNYRLLIIPYTYTFDEVKEQIGLMFND